MSAELGWIYVAHSPAMPDIYKIGATTSHPLERAKQLSASSGVPIPFGLVYIRHVAQPFQVEAAMHRAFANFRVNESREFFRVKLADVIQLAENYTEAREEFYSDEFPTPFADLFKTFPDDGSPRKLTAKEQFECRELEHRLREKKQVYLFR